MLLSTSLSFGVGWICDECEGWVDFKKAWINISCGYSICHYDEMIMNRQICMRKKCNLIFASSITVCLSFSLKTFSPFRFRLEQWESGFKYSSIIQTNQSCLYVGNMNIIIIYTPVLLKYCHISRVLQYRCLLFFSIRETLRNGEQCSKSQFDGLTYLNGKRYICMQYFLFDSTKLFSDAKYRRPFTDCQDWNTNIYSHKFGR